MDVRDQFPQGDTVNSSVYASLDCISWLRFATGEAQDGNTFAAGPRARAIIAVLVSSRATSQHVASMTLYWGISYYIYNKRKGTHAAQPPHCADMPLSWADRMHPPLTFLLISPLHLCLSTSYHPSLLSQLILCTAVFEVRHQKPWKLFKSCIVHLFILLFFIMHSLLHVTPKCPNCFAQTHTP